jgi:hypothetical protein
MQPLEHATHTIITPNNAKGEQWLVLGLLSHAAAACSCCYHATMAPNVLTITISRATVPDLKHVAAFIEHA